MSEFDADQGEHDENTPEIDLADPDDYHRTQRLKEIHKARQRVHTTMDGFDYPKAKKEKVQRQQLAYAVSMYVTELENVITDADASTSLPDRYPWDNVQQYADTLGVVPDDHPHPFTYSPKQDSVQVFRTCNSVLADVKPLIEESEDTEWEV